MQLASVSVLVPTLVVHVGRAGVARDAVRAGLPSAIETAVDAGVDPTNQKRIVDGIDPKMVRAATEKVLGGARAPPPEPISP